jgi:NAD(P)-dependent dehydrogenase (short-subunit alcohol dehydrogenase family)
MMRFKGSYQSSRFWHSPTDKAKSVADSINKSGGQAIAAPGDMLDDKYLDSLVKQAAEFGNGKIHIIVNNAGYTWDGVIHKVSESPDHPIQPLSK